MCFYFAWTPNNLPVCSKVIFRAVHLFAHTQRYEKAEHEENATFDKIYGPTHIHTRMHAARLNTTDTRREYFCNIYSFRFSRQRRPPESKTFLNPGVYYGYERNKREWFGVGWLGPKSKPMIFSRMLIFYWRHVPAVLKWSYYVDAIVHLSQTIRFYCLAVALALAPILSCSLLLAMTNVHGFMAIWCSSLTHLFTARCCFAHRSMISFRTFSHIQYAEKWMMRSLNSFTFFYRSYEDVCSDDWH